MLFPEWPHFHILLAVPSLAFHSQILWVIILPDFLNGISTGRSEIASEFVSRCPEGCTFIFELLSGPSSVWLLELSTFNSFSLGKIKQFYF